jgi:hypothetical protein
VLAAGTVVVIVLVGLFGLAIAGVIMLIRMK